MKKEVLDTGFVEVIDSLGTDLTVVNSARVSFGKRHTKYTKGDKHLVKYLAKYKHFSPFRHMMVQFHIKAPEFVMRQWYKHVVGIETTSSYPTKDHAWNEISGRYTPVTDYYIPEVWRKQSQDNKQASEGELNDLQQKRMTHLYERYLLDVERVYETMVQTGMAKEQARVVLPLSQYTEVYWTASFQAIMNFIDLRDEKTAQWEIQQYAKVMKEMMFEIYPKTTKIWSEIYW
jgi:thymidylate synthase (FAD)|tara:strand:- start:1390 stop:2085 length:696 start_codon:yes stop_codon:yes gene_type:complete